MAAPTRSCLPPWDLQQFDAEFWDRAQLARAAVAAHSADAWLPMLAKLQAGQPIVILALGSSIVDGHAGCFGSRAAAAAAGVGALPQAMRRYLNATEDATCAVAGYASAFLAAINATWPHPGHLLVNAGVAGTMLGQFARDVCVEGWLPAASGADLLLFETHGGDSENASTALKDIEQLYYETVTKMPPLRNATRGGALPSPPPLVLLHMHPIGPRHVAANGTGDDGSSACVGAFGSRCASCGAGDALAARLEAAAGNGVEDGLAAAVRRYGWSSISMRDALLAALCHGDGAKRMGWSSCELINAFMKDRVHPSLPGRRLLADAMIQLLLQTQEAVLARRECDASGAPGVALPATPLSRDAWTRSERRCVVAEQLKPRTARGWSFHETELVRNATVFKPGWLASEPGAVLEVSIGSTRLASLSRRRWPRLDARFLVSYERMGNARLECVAGCTCRASTLPAYLADEHESVEGAYGVLVSQADDCVVRVTTLPESQSPDGGTKFKLIGFSLVADRRGIEHSTPEAQTQTIRRRGALL